MYVYEAVYVLAVPELNGLLRKIASRCQFLRKSCKEFSIMTFYDFLKFLYSEKVKNFCEIFTVDLSYIVKFMFSKKATQTDKIFTVDLTFTK